MKMLFVVGIFLWGFCAYAAIESEESEFAIDEGLVRSIYSESVGELSEERDSSFAVEVAFTMLTPQNWRLGNDYFQTQYSQNVDILPTIELSIGIPVLRSGSLLIEADLGAGYGFQNGVYTTQSSSGESRTDNIQLHRIPLSTGFTISYRPRFPVAPFLSAGLGLQWAYQVGSLDGFDQGFWIPYYTLQPGVLLFAPTTAGRSWFGGVKIGATLVRSFATEQETHATGASIGIHLVL